MLTKTDLEVIGYRLSSLLEYELKAGCEAYAEQAEAAIAMVKNEIARLESGPYTHREALLSGRPFRRPFRKLESGNTTGPDQWKRLARIPALDDGCNVWRGKYYTVEVYDNGKWAMPAVGELVNESLADDYELMKVID